MGSLGEVTGLVLVTMIDTTAVPSMGRWTMVRSESSSGVRTPVCTFSVAVRC